MTTRETLIRAVLASPSSDVPRLIYADWLDEHGEESRAELIRVQVELAEKEVAHKDCGPLDGACDDCRLIKRLRRRERELLLHHGPEWAIQCIPNRIRGVLHSAVDASLQVVLADGDEVEFRFARGFISEFHGPWSAWLAAEKVLAWCPMKCKRCKGRGHLGGPDVDDVLYTKECPACSGSGVIEPSEVCCECEGETYVTNHCGETQCYASMSGMDCECGCAFCQQSKDCEWCSAAGRVPRPFPLTAQPLTDVHFTDQPHIEFRGFAVSHQDGRNGAICRLEGGEWQEFPEGDSEEERTLKLLEGRWPGIRFHLPLTESQQELADGLNRRRVVLSSGNLTGTVTGGIEPRR